ncbi:MAG: imidazole glycerol phosphate synthase subunit HisH [Chloroflexi bacterium OLB15]|nr:MAG: imidazole glycerol phosphate synthase subunit HisH [Chloroflexi bacterium OLB15]
MLAVIDYGAGNLRSVVHALNYLGAENLRVVRTPYEMRGATKIILPGVGAFGAGMNQLREQNLITTIRDAVFAGTPYLGICLGMQFLFTSSSEMGNHDGLGILPGRVTRFTDQPGLKVPHIGWNQLQLNRESALMRGISEAQYAFFVHSYYCVPENPADVLITTQYGIPFTSGVQHGNIYGVQFHPEKSQRTGLQLLKNFLELPQ